MGKVVVGAAVICAATVCAATALVVRHRMRCSARWAKAMNILNEFEESCGTPIDKLKQVADAMNMEMRAGLATEGGSKIKMLISYVDNLPTGYVSSYIVCVWLAQNLVFVISMFARVFCVLFDLIGLVCCFVIVFIMWVFIV